MPEGVNSVLSCPICQSNDIKEFLQTRDHAISKQTFELDQCQSCQFVFTQNMPDPNHIGPFYASEEYVSHSDTKKGLINQLYHLGRKWMLDYKLKMVKKTLSAKRLLDFGAGTAYFLQHMKQHGFAVNGVEIDDKARDFAQNQFNISLEKPAQFLQEKANTTYDIITLWHVLEHLHDLHAVLNKFRSILAKQGRLFVAVPNRTSKDADHYKEYWAGYDVPRHLWHFSPENLKSLAKNHGFEIESIQFLPLDPFYNSMLSEQYKNSSFGLFKATYWGLLAWIAGYLNKEKASSPVYILKHAT